MTPSYTWIITKPDGSTVSGSGAVANIMTDNPGTYSCTFTASANRNCPPPEITLGPELASTADLNFVEDSSQKYGFDDYSNRNNNPVVSYKSVEVGLSDTALLNINPATIVSDIFITSSDTSKVTVSPATASTSPQTITVTGVARGESDIDARNGGIWGSRCAKMRTTAYNKVQKSVAIILIHEENDDVQVIPVGQGKPDTIAIESGINGMVDTTPLGDDQIVTLNPNTPSQRIVMTTGTDGVCNTSKIQNSDDIQMIPYNQGESNVLCVNKGNNNFRDSSTSGDDVVVGDDIDTGADGVCDTLALDRDVLSTDVGSDMDIQLYLNSKIYNQAVFEWQVTKLPAKTINFDLNRDGTVDVISWMSSEMAAIRNGAQDLNFNNNVFLVNYPNDGSFGFANFNQTFAFIHPDTSPDPNTTIAHELGHAAYGLTHSSGLGSSENIMTQGAQPKWRLFYGQWNSVNP